MLSATPEELASHQVLSPVAFIERAGLVFTDRVAVVDGPVTHSWAALRDRSRRLASALRQAGVRKGDRVAFLALNGEPLLLAHFGVLQAGAVLVALNTRLTAEELSFILGDCGSQMIFYSPELKPTLADLPPHVRTVSLDDEFEGFLAGGSVEPVPAWMAVESEMCAVNYTSGTTGRPKGVIYSHRGAYLNALGMVIENHLTASSTVLWTLPMFHCNGWSQTWAVAAAGARSISIPRIDAGSIWHIIESEGVSHFNAAPTVLTMLAKDPNARPLKHTVRVATGGAPPSPTLLRQMASLNIDIVHLYGLTETYGPLTLSVMPEAIQSWSSEDVARYKARQGFGHVSAGEIRAVDETMADVPWDGQTVGEIVARGNTVAVGYYQRPAETAEAFRGGWFHTGDLGVVHPDGSIELRDRMKDIIISGGENISTIEVENAILRHPDVIEVAIVGVPHPFWGEVPKAFIDLRPESQTAADDIVQFARTQLASFKVPKEVHFGPLPKTSTGKIQKAVLRDREWTGHQRRIH